MNRYYSRRPMRLMEAPQQMQNMQQMQQMPQMQQGGLGGMSADDMDFADDEEIQGGQGMQGGEDYEMTQEDPNEAMGDDMEMEQGAQPFSENGDVDSIVTNIREMCLKGLQILADDIEDPAYDLLKKMWLMCDKAQTPDDNNQNGQN